MKILPFAVASDKHAPAGGGGAPARVRGAQALDRMLASVGAEFRSLLIIALALAILCAPVGFGLAATYILARWAGHASGSGVIGWLTGLAVFCFFCRYVWGARLQSASRRAAEALIAAKTN